MERLTKNQNEILNNALNKEFPMDIPVKDISLGEDIKLLEAEGLITPNYSVEISSPSRFTITQKGIEKLQETMANQNYSRYFLITGTCILLAVAIIYAYSSLKQPEIPIYIVVWGFMGGASYVAKTVAFYMGSGKFDDKFIPYHLTRLVLGPALALIVYFIVKSGGIFGITLGVAADKEFYAYAVLAFGSGYFVRHVIDVLSRILDTVFNLPKDAKDNQNKG